MQSHYEKVQKCSKKYQENKSAGIPPLPPFRWSESDLWDGERKIALLYAFQHADENQVVCAAW